MAQFTGSAAKRKAWANFARGYNSVRQPQDMTSDELADVMNLRYIMTPSGIGLTNRPGMVKLTSPALAAAPVKDIHKYVDTAGSSRIMAVCTNTLFLSTTGTGSYASLGALGSTRGRMVNFAGKCIIADGVAMRQYNGTATATCSGTPPVASFLAVHGDRLFANSTAVKNAIYFCNVRDNNDWTTAGATGAIYISESNELTAFSKFYDKLLIHGIGPKNVMALTGTTPMDIAVTRAIPGAASVGPDQAIVLSNDVVFLDSPGLISFRSWQNYGDIEQAIVSDPVSNIINPMVANTVVCGRNPIDQQTWYWDGSSAYIMVYDAQYHIWTKYWLELGASVTPTCIADLDGVLYVGTSDGNIWKMDTTGAVFTDNSVGYTAYWRSAAENFGTLKKKNARAYWPQVTLGAGATAYANVYKDLSSAPLVQVAMTGAPSRILGTMTGTGDTVLLATYLVDESGGVVKNQRVNFEFVYLQIGMTGIVSGNYRMTVNPHAVEVVPLSRY